MANSKSLFRSWKLFQTNVIDCAVVGVACVQWVMHSPRYEMLDSQMDTVDWRLMDDSELYWFEEVIVPTPTREVQQAEWSEAVKNYLKKEEERCLEKLASSSSSMRNVSVTRGPETPPCPCVSSDLRTYMYTSLSLSVCLSRSLSLFACVCFTVFHHSPCVTRVRLHFIGYPMRYVSPQMQISLQTYFSPVTSH